MALAPLCAILRDEKALRVIFQTFIYNFLRREQEVFAVSAEQRSGPASVDRDGQIGSPSDAYRCGAPEPGSDDQIADEALWKLFTYLGSTTGKRRPRRHQLFAYMVNMRAREPSGTQIEGILLYPSTDSSAFDLRWHVSDMPLRVISVNLAWEWPTLKQSLLKTLHIC